jgi:hypothetical protein
VLKDRHAADDEVEEIVVEGLVVVYPDAVAHKRAVVIEPRHAAAAYPAVL